MQVILNQEQTNVLKVINRVYNETKKGCQTIELTTSQDTLKILETFGIIFRTKEGWFPSTAGQNYIIKYGN